MTVKAISRRRFLAISGILGVTSLVASACVIPPAESEQRESPMDADATVILRHWQHHWPHDYASRATTVEEFKMQFEADNPDVTLDFQSIPWADYWSQLAEGIAAGRGSAPDVFQIPMGLIDKYMAQDQLSPVPESVVSQSEIETQYLPWTMQRGLKDGQYYGLPLDVQTLVMFRNDEIYREAGLDPSVPYEDLADLQDQAVLLTQLEGQENDRIGINTGYYSAFQTLLFQQFLQREQGGQPWVDPHMNQLVWHYYPEILESFQWFCELSRTADDSSFLSGENRFAQGRAAMEFGHPVSRIIIEAQNPNLSYTIVPFPPRSVNQELYTAGSHWLWVVGEWTSVSETAWRWAHWGTKAEAQVAWHAAAGDLPSNPGLANDSHFRPDTNANVCLDSLQYATPWEWIGWTEWVLELRAGRNRVVMGGEEPSSSFDTMVANLNEVIAVQTRG